MKIAKDLTVEQIENLADQGILTFVRSAEFRLSSALLGCNALPYDGLFGRGFVIYRPSGQLTQDITVEYYIYV